MKDNRPLEDKLADRVIITDKKESGDFKLELLHCHESDTGVYTARAENLKGNAHCTAQLIVQECMYMKYYFCHTFIGILIN